MKRVFRGWRIFPDVDYEEFAIRWKATKKGQRNLYGDSIWDLKGSISEAEGDAKAANRRRERIKHARKLFKELMSKKHEYLGWQMLPVLGDDQATITWCARKQGEKQIDGDTFAHVKMHIMSREDEPGWRRFLERLL